MKKADCRRHMQALRKRLTPTQHQCAATQLVYRITALSQWQRTQHIALYFPFGSELDTRPLIAAAWASGRQVYLPCIHAKKQLYFKPYTPQTRLIQATRNISEPQTDTLFPFAQLDMVGVPLLAYDHDNFRLGMGGGYYDRLLATRTRAHRPYCVGLAFHFQYQEKLPLDKWDQPLDRVVCVPTQ